MATVNSCYDLFLGSGAAVTGVTQGACVKLLISKLLGWLIIAGSCVVKVPQIRKFIKAGRAEGVSVSMYILETIGYTITVAFNLSRGYPFSTYGENGFIWVQNIILIYLMYSYASALNARFVALVVAYTAFAVTLFSGTLSADAFSILQSATVPIFTASKLPQIWQSYRSKSTGQLAFITCAMNFGGVVARAFTIFAEAPDPILKAGVLSASFFNGIIVAQFFLYWNNTPAVPVAVQRRTDSKTE